MKQDFDMLRSIDIQAYVTVNLLLKVLGRLPSLEDLRFMGTMFEPYSELCVSLEMSRRLKSLQVDSGCFAEDDKRVAMLVRRCPGLVQVRKGGIIEETMKALLFLEGDSWAPGFICGCLEAAPVGDAASWLVAINNKKKW